MKLERAQELYTDYLEGTLSAAMRLALEQHFDSDPGARADYEQFASVAKLLSRPVAEIEPPIDFRAKIMERASIEYGRRQQQPTFWQSLSQALFPQQRRPLAGAFAAGLVLVVVGAVFLRPQSGGRLGLAGMGPGTFLTPTMVPQSTLRGVETTQGGDGYVYHLIDVHLPSSVPSASVQAWVLTSDDQIVDPNARARSATPALPAGQTIAGDEQIKIPIAYAHTQAQGATLDVMVQWRSAAEPGRHGTEVVFTPIDDGDGMSPLQAEQSVHDNANFYDQLQAVASGYHVTVIVDAATAPTAPVSAWTSDQSAVDAIRTVAEPVGYVVDTLPGKTFLVRRKE